MRVLVTSPACAQRLHNLVPLGWALRAAGHDVQVAVRPAFAVTVNRTGLVAASAGPDGAGSDAGADWLADPADVDGAVRYAALWRPDLVVWDGHAPAGAVAARTCGAASVRMLGPLDHAGTDTQDPESAVLSRLGDAPSRHGLVGPDLLRADLTLDTTPPGMRTLHHGDGAVRTVRHVPYDGPSVVPAWLRRLPRRPRIHLHLGGAHAPLAEAFGAIGAVDAEVICALPADRIPAGVDLPENVRLLDTVPLQALLPTCGAVVHDGSPVIGAAATVYGLPHLAVEAGVSAPVLAERIRLLLTDPQLRAAAERARDESAALPAPRGILPELVRLAVQATDKGSVSGVR